MYKNRINLARKLGASVGGKVAAVGTGLTLAAGSAMAEVPESVTTALGDLATDVAIVAGLAFVAYLVIVGFRMYKSGTGR